MHHLKLKQRTFDVVVAGGGPAGVCAAVAAARAGARVLLVERGTGLGGNVRAAHVHSICGLYRIGGSRGAVPLNGGLSAEMVSMLAANGGSGGPHRFGKVDVLLQEPEVFAEVCSGITKKTPGLEVATGTTVKQADARGRILQTVRVESPGGSIEIGAGAFVDCSGDATLGALAGAGFERPESNQLQRPAFIFAIGDVESRVLDVENRLTASARILNAVRSGDLPAGLLHCVMRPTCRAGLVRFTLDLEAGGADYDPLDENQIRELTKFGKELAERLLVFLKSRVEGFREARMVGHGERIGIRESRRLIGRKTLTAEDVLSGAQPDDTVVLASWPMEWHEPGQPMRLVFPREDAPYGIPLGALRSRDLDNLLVAGRCVSATREAQASVRVIGSAMATGQAAGLAAASLAENRTPDSNAIRSACAA